MRSYISFPSKLHQKIHRKNVDFSSIKIRSKKIIETTSILRSSKLRRAKYVERTSILYLSKLHWKGTSKWRKNLLIFYFRHINVISTLNQRRFDVVCPVRTHLDKRLTKMTHKSEFHRLKVWVERNDSLKLVIWAETNYKFFDSSIWVQLTCCVSRTKWLT